MKAFVYASFFWLLSISLGWAQAGAGYLGGSSIYTVLTPSGKTDATDTNNLQTALNNAGKIKAPVMLSAGNYALCHPVTIASGNDGVALLGPSYLNPDPGQGGISGVAIARLDMTACASPTFTTGQAAILVNSQMNTFSGFSIYGVSFTGGSGINIDCIHTTTGGQVIRFMGLQGCYNGVYLEGASTSYSGYNQVNHIDHNTITFNTNGVLCQVTTGNGCTDNIISDNHIDDFNTAGIACLGGCGFSQFENNRIEDGGSECIEVAYASVTTAELIISGNHCQSPSFTPLYFQNAYDVNVVNNNLLCASGTNAISFYGSATNGLIHFEGNIPNGGCAAMYYVDASSGVFTGSVNDWPINTGTTAYYAGIAASEMEPLQAIPRDAWSGGYRNTAPSGTTFTPIMDGNQRDFEFDFVANSTIAAPAYFVSGAYGIIRIKQDATGGRTVTWGSANYVNQPALPALTANTCTLIPYNMTGSKAYLGSPIVNTTC